MAMVLNEDQNMLRDSAAGFCRDKAPITEFRKLRDEKDETGFSRELWQEMAEQGWAGSIFPEDVGGFDFGYLGLGLILEETGKTLVCSPLVSTVLVAGTTVHLAGNESQQQEILPAIIGGERLMTLALEEGSVHNPTRIKCRAQKNGAGYTITGEKKMVLDGHVADQLIVVARTSGEENDADGITLFLVDGDAKGVTRSRTHMVDSRNTANIVFDNVEVDEASVLGEVGGASSVLDTVLDRARVGLAAEMVGGICEAFKITIEYLKTREQFGVLIGTFQALQHRAAHIFAEVEMTISVVREALSAIDEGSDRVPVLASLAKAKANDTLFLVSNESIQMHGGIGMTDECDIGFYLKRSRVASETFGNSRFLRSRYATLKGY